MWAVGFGVLIFSRIPYELLDPRPCLGEDGTLGQDRKVCVLLFWMGCGWWWSMMDYASIEYDI